MAAPIREPGQRSAATARHTWPMDILAMAGLIVITLASAYLLWSLLLRAEQRYAQLESHGQTAADIAGIAFLGLAGMIVLGASTALLLEARGLIHALLL